MEKEFVPYELALELKQLGFDEPCISHYTVYGKFSNDYSAPRKYNSEFELGSYISAPLYQQAFRWFREKYGLCGVYMMGDDWNSFEFNIWRNDTMTKTFVISSNWVYETYEEAELACLQKLIEIVKTK